MKLKDNTEIVIGNYPFADSLNKEILYQFQFAEDIGHTNVKAFHTVWNWLPNNQKIKNFKSFISLEIEKNYRLETKILNAGKITDVWGNLYKKGDHAQSHRHRPGIFSFVYFVKAKWYDSPLIFDDSGKKVRPKEGRYVIFPSHLFHSVPKHRYNCDRITLAGNYELDQ